MPAATEKVLPAVDTLTKLLQTVPADARREKAFYHLDRLKKALIASHQEAQGRPSAG